MQTHARHVEQTASAPRLANMSESSIEEVTKDQCMTMEVGGSQSSSKSVRLPSSNYVCPVMVDRSNWVGTQTYGDTFQTSQKGADLTVTRTDASAGWGMNLKIRCCKTYDGPKLSSCLFLHGAMVKGARPTQFKSWYGDISGALRTYWGPFNIWYADLCNEFIFGWAETETNSWTDAELQNSYADKAAEVINSGGVVFAHSMANAILAGACWQRSKCVQWYSLGGGYSGQAIGTGILDVLKALGPLGTNMMNTKVYEGFDFTGSGMRHDPEKEHRNAMAKVVDAKGLLKGSVCGIRPAGGVLSGDTKKPDWGLDITTALKHENRFDQKMLGVGMLAAAAVVQGQLRAVGDDERSDGLVEVAACAFWEDVNGRHWYGTGSEWKTVGSTADPSETHILAEINHIEECGVFPQTSVAQNWMRNMMCRELQAQGKACPSKSIAMEWPSPSGKIGEACIWPLNPCSDGDCCSNKGHSICQRKLTDWAGIPWCPAECQGIPGFAGTCEDETDRVHWPRKNGEMCIFDTDCENWNAADPMGCCNHVCTRKKKDWAGVWWCPDICKSQWWSNPGSC